MESLIVPFITVLTSREDFFLPFFTIATPLESETVLFNQNAYTLLQESTSDQAWLMLPRPKIVGPFPGTVSLSSTAAIIMRNTNP